MKAGNFKQDEDGTIYGKIQALGLGNIECVLIEKTRKADKPFYKVVADPNGDAFEIGTAWPKTMKDEHGKTITYYSFALDTVYSDEPINAALFPDRTNKNHFNLVYNPLPKDKQPEAKADAKAEKTAEVQSESVREENAGLFHPSAQSETPMSAEGKRNQKQSNRKQRTLEAFP